MRVQVKWLSIALAATGAVLLAGWALSQQSVAQPAQPALDLAQRIASLEQENQQDYKSIRDLYLRIQMLEQRLTQVQNDLNQRIATLTRENEAYRQQVNQSLEELSKGRRAYTGYPALRGVQRDQSGNVILDFAR